MMRFEGKVVVVTGSSRGIGRAIAAEFVGGGAVVVGFGRDGSTGVQTMTALDESGERARFMEVDVSDESGVHLAISDVLATFGRIDVLVNNAAVQREARLVDVTVADFRAMVDVNLLGTCLVSSEVLPSMVKRRAGVIVNMSSVLGFAAVPLLPIYAATKAGIIALTRATAITYAQFGIRANAVCPGDVDTELNRANFASQPDPQAFRSRVEAAYPLRRIARPEEVAQVVVFLASDDASFVNGTVIVVDGGLSARLYDVGER